MFKNPKIKSDIQKKIEYRDFCKYQQKHEHFIKKDTFSCFFNNANLKKPCGKRKKCYKRRKKEEW